MTRREARAGDAGGRGRFAPTETPEERRFIPNGRELSSLLDAVTASGATVRIVAHGRSMLPLIRDGDALVVARAEGPPPLGAVVAIAAPPSGRLLFHRVVARRGSRVLVRGDNVLRPDGWVEIPAVLGAVERVERGGRPVWIGSVAVRPILALLCRTGFLRLAARVICHRWNEHSGQPA